MTDNPNPNAIEVIDVTGTALEQYQDRSVTRELAARLMSMHPAANEVGQAGMLLVAQTAILIGASPLPAINEIHVWRDEKGRIQLQLGINFWRRRAEDHGGIRWTISPRPMHPDEVIMYGLRDGEIGALCSGMTRDTFQICRSDGMSYDQAIAAASMIGIGSVALNERTKKGKPPIWTAMKRAETDMLRHIVPWQPGGDRPGPGMTRLESGYAPDESAWWNPLQLPAAADPDHEPLDLDTINEDLFGDA